MNRHGRSIFLAFTVSIGAFDSANAGWLLGPDSYHECILDRVAGSTDDPAATQQTISCRDDFSPMAPEEPLHPFLFGPQNLRECLEKYLAETSAPFAVSQIQEACMSLYPDSGESTPSPQ